MFSPQTNHTRVCLEPSETTSSTRSLSDCVGPHPSTIDVFTPSHTNKTIYRLRICFLSLFCSFQFHPASHLNLNMVQYKNSLLLLVTVLPAITMFCHYLYLPFYIFFICRSFLKINFTTIHLQQLLQIIFMLSGSSAVQHLHEQCFLV